MSFSVESEKEVRGKECLKKEPGIEVESRDDENGVTPVRGGGDLLQIFWQQRQDSHMKLS